MLSSEGLLKCFSLQRLGSKRLSHEASAAVLTNTLILVFCYTHLCIKIYTICGEDLSWEAHIPNRKQQKALGCSVIAGQESLMLLKKKSLPKYCVGWHWLSLFSSDFEAGKKPQQNQTRNSVSSFPQDKLPGSSYSEYKVWHITLH